MKTSCIYAPEGNQKKVANILSGNTETGKITEQDKAILAQFNDWWQSVGSNKFPLEEGVDIFGEGVLEAHPEIVEAFNNRTKTAQETRSKFIADTIVEIEKVYKDFPNYIDRADAYETLSILIDNEVQKLQKENSNVEPDFDSIKANVFDVLSDLVTKYKEAADDPEYSDNRDLMVSLYQNISKLIDNLNGLWANAITRYKNLYSGMSSVSRINEEGTDIGEEDNGEDNQGVASQDNDYSGKDHYEDTFGKKSIEENATKLVKNILIQMTYKDENGEDILSKFGVPRRIPSGTIYAQLATLLVNVKSQDEMEDRIRRFSEKKQGYWAKKLVELFDSASNADDIKNAMFVTFNKAYVTYTNQIIKNGEVASQNFDKTDAALTLISNWKGAIDGIVSLRGAKNSEEKGTIYENDGEKAYDNLYVIMTLIGETLRDFKKPVDANMKMYKDNFKTLFSTLGIELNDETLNLIVSYVPNSDDYDSLPKNPDDARKKLLSDIHEKVTYILNLLKRRKNEKTGIVFEDVRRDLSDLANIIGEKFSPEVQRSTKIGRDIRYNTVNNSFLFTQEKYLFRGTKDDVESWVKKQLLNDPWFNVNKVFNAVLTNAADFLSYLPILNDLADRHKYVRQIYVENENGNEYKEMTAKEILVAQYTKFLSGIENAKVGQKAWSWYKDGLFGDSSKFMFIQAPVYEREDVVGYISNIVLQEYRRIKDVRAILAERANGNLINIDRNLAVNGLKFNFFPLLNDIREEGKTFIEKLDELQDNPTAMMQYISSVLYNGKTGRGILTQIVKEDKETLLKTVRERPEFRINSTTLIWNYNYMHKNAPISLKTAEGSIVTVSKKGEQASLAELRDYKKAITEIIVQKKEEKKAGYESDVSYLERIIKEIDKDLRRNPARNIDLFLYNNLLVSIELMELRDKDPAYYKDFTDYIKRCKQSAGDYVSLNTSVSEGGKTEEKILILEDFKYKISEEDLKPIYDIIDRAKAKEKLSPRQAKFLKEKWAEVIKATDGQMYRTIASKRNLDKMLAIEDSTGIGKEIYDTLEKDRVPTAEQIANAGKVTSSMKEYGYAINPHSNFTPTQLKNGTQMLNTTGRNSGIYRHMLRLRAIQRFAEENGYDAVVFASGMKVGLPMKEDVISFDDDAVIKKIEAGKGSQVEKETGIVNRLNELAMLKPNSTMTFDYQFLGEQTKERNAIVDHIDMTIGTQLTKIAPSVLYNVNEVSIKGKTLSGKEAFSLYHAAAVLGKIKEWGELLQLFNDKKLFSKSMMGAMLSSKKFSATIFEGMQTDENGNPLIPYNDPTIRSLLEDKLLAKGRKKLSKVLTNGNGDHFYTASDAGLSEKYKLGVKYDENGNLKYVECYVPSIYKEWVEEFAERDAEGNMLFSLDKSKIVKFKEKNIKAYNKIKALFDVIGYRVPTEGMCSIIPMRIKGFLPLTNQSTIILPSEMITRTGHDMDGDEIFFLKYAQREYSKKDFIKDNNLLDADEKTQDEEWEKNKGDYENAIVRVGYSLSDAAIKAIKDKDWETLFKEIGDFSKDQIHNLIMDLLFATCTSEQGTLDSVRFSSFEDIDRTASLINYINALKKTGDIKAHSKEVMGMLDATSSEVKSKIEKLGKTPILSPMSLTQSIGATVEALAGKKFLGIFAVGKAVGAITMATDCTVINGPVINGKKLENLSIYTHKDSKESPAANNGQAVAACPDNSKNPTLLAFGVNDTTVNVIQVLIQGGFDLQTIGLLLNQPVVKRICTYAEAKDTKPNVGIITDALNEMAEEMKRKSTVNDFFDAATIQQIINGSYIDTSSAALLSNIINGDSMGEKDKKNQLAIGVLFRDLFSIGQEYSERSMCLRGDSPSGSAGSTNEETLKRIQIVKDYKKKRNSRFSEDFPINTDYVPQKHDSESSIFTKVMASSFPLVNAQYVMGLRGYLNLMSDAFPELNTVWSDAIHARKNYSRKNFKINDLYSFLWHPLIKGDASKSMTENIVDAIVTMPTRLQRLKENPKYKNNAFIKDLNYSYSKIGDTDKEIPVIYSKATKARSRVQVFQIAPISDGWAQLMIDQDSEIRQFATDMYRYFLYVYGNFWAQGSLATYRPNIVALSISDYTSTLESAFTKNDALTLEQFTKQSLYNHLDLYAISASSSVYKNLGIEKEDTSEVIRQKLEKYPSISKGYGLLYLKGADGVKIYIEDISGSSTQSIYQEVKPRSVKLGGVKVLNLDAYTELGQLQDMEKMLLDRAEEAKVIVKKDRKQLEKLEDQMEIDDSVGEALKTESYAEFHGEQTSFEGYSDEDLLNMYGAKESNSIEVQDIEPKTNEDGIQVDKDDNPKCTLVKL